jgi:hypothetical protein
MNKRKGFSSVLMAALYVGLSAACIIALPYGCSMKRIVGSGNIISQSRDVPEFSRIHLKGIGRVILEQSHVSSVSIKTDDNIQPLIQTVVQDNTLVISHESFNLKPTILEFHLNVPQPQGISISGSGDCHLSISESLRAEITGSGNIIYTGRPRIESLIKGSGSVKGRD